MMVMFHGGLIFPENGWGSEPFPQYTQACFYLEIFISFKSSMRLSLQGREHCVPHQFPKPLAQISEPPACRTPGQQSGEDTTKNKVCRAQGSGTRANSSVHSASQPIFNSHSCFEKPHELLRKCCGFTSPWPSADSCPWSTD